MLKNQEKIFQNFKGPRENRQKYRKTCEKTRPSKISKNIRQKYRKTGKMSETR